jgi:K+-sensing histidine kinase KdpD
LFNFIQNAVKYNLNNGEIMINYSLQEKPRMSSNSINASPTIELVTKITDTGKGIEQDRIQFMFVLFGELRKKQELRKVKDLGIGVGLSCSKELS